MESLKKNDDFRKCYNTGKSYVNRDLVLYVCGNDLGKNRIGISVSKKVGNSVVRHRITRLIRESYRLHEQMFNSGLDMVVVARSRAKEADYHRIDALIFPHAPSTDWKQWKSTAPSREDCLLCGEFSDVILFLTEDMILYPENCLKAVF